MFLSKLFQKKTNADGGVRGSSGYVPEAWEVFEDEHGSECYRIEEKLRNVNTDSSDPEKNLAGFDRQVELAHELEEFCRSFGDGGSEFFRINFSTIYSDIEMYRNQYLAEDYEADKKSFAETKAEMEAVRKLSASILKEIRRRGGSALQKDLKKSTPEEQLRLFDKAIRRLSDSGKIEKQKNGQFILLVLKEKTAAPQ